MSVVEVKLLSSGQTGKDVLYLGRRDYEQKWGVRTDCDTDGPVIAKGTRPVPQYGDFYKTTTEFDERAFLRERDCDRIHPDNPRLFVITCRFSTVADNGEGKQELPAAIPFDTSPVPEWDFHEDKEPAYFCYGNRDEPLPIVNSAGDFYDPPPERDIARPIYRTVINQANYDPLVAADYANSVNSDNWMGFPPCTVMCKPPKARWAAQSGVSYWAVTYEFHFNFRGWFKFYWDAGLREFVSKEDIDNKRVQGFTKPGYQHMTNDDGTFVTEPQLLNGRGLRLVPKGGVLTPERAQEGLTSFKFRVQHKRPFGRLNIF